MITVTTDFKDAMKASTKQIKAYLVDQEVYPTEITESDDLQSIIIKSESSLLRTVMRQAEVVHFGAHNFLDKYVNLGLGVVLPDTSSEYIDYGSFKVVFRETIKGSNQIKLKLFDKMYESLITWDLDPIYDRTYPCTAGELLQAICDRLGWTLATTSFPNSDTSINQDYLTDVITTYRQALEMIAELSASIIFFDVNDELVVKNVSHDTTVETLDQNILNTLAVETNFGPINSVVLSRMPQEDNIVQKDQTSIDTDGLTELKVVNNLIVDSSREIWIDAMFNELNGLEFHPFEGTTNGLGYLQIGDRVVTEDPQSNEFDAVILGIELRITGGLTERFFADVPDKSNTNYNTAGIIGQMIRNTQIIVDKQSGVITLLNEQTQENTTDISELQQTVDGITIAVESIGGTNLIKNSVGLKGTFAEWQILDEAGDPVDARNTATIDQSLDVEQNTESGSAFRLEDNFLVQTIPTIIGETYTVYCRFKKSTETNVTIGGIGEVEIVTDLYIDDTWAIFKYPFIATLSSTSIQIENEDAYAIIADFVVKLGDVTGWTQAPNEVYGSNYRFDKDGFQITSPNNQLRSLLDNEKLAVYDDQANKTMMLVSKDSGIITRLVVQEYVQIQRYENPSKSAKILPTATGALLIIND